jgi:biotin transporter BioY
MKTAQEMLDEIPRRQRCKSVRLSYIVFIASMLAILSVIATIGCALLALVLQHWNLFLWAIICFVSVIFWTAIFWIVGLINRTPEVRKLYTQVE